MKIKFYCQDCKKEIKGMLTPEGCPKCQSMNITKKEFVSHREWVNWWNKTGKKDAASWYRRNYREGNLERH